MESEICIYCSVELDNESKSREHVIPRCLFSSEYKKNAKNDLWVVPACGMCNKSFSVDEEHFRNLLIKLAHGESSHADEIFLGKHKRSLQRSKKLMKLTLDSLDLVNVFTPHGIYVKQMTGIHISENDWERYYNVLDKIVKGLFYKEHNVTLPDDFLIKHVYIHDESKMYPYKNQKWYFHHKDIAACGFNYIPETLESIYTLVFYKHIIFQSFVAKKDVFGKII